MALTAMPGLLATQSPAASLHHPAPLATTGRIIFVDSTQPGAADDNVGDNPLRPKATWVAALRALRQSGFTNRGDQIWLMPGHAETVRIAAGIPMNVAGVSVFGLGHGASKPRITFESSTAASILISAASCRIANIIGIPGIAALTQPFDVTANDCTLDIEWQDASATTSASRAILATSVSRLDFTLKYLGFAGALSTVNGIRLVSCSHVDIGIDAYGYVSSAWVDFTSACTNVKVNGTVYTDGFTDGSRLVSDLAGSSTWMADVFDMTTGYRWAGGSGAATAVVTFPSDTAALSPVGLNNKQIEKILENMELDEVADGVEWLREQVYDLRETLDITTEEGTFDGS